MKQCSPPPREGWRKVIIACMFLLAVGCVFASRTKRFKEVVSKVELSLDEKRKRSADTKVAKNSASAATVKDPERALENAEKQWNAELAGKDPGGDLDIESEIKSREALGARLEKISEGSVADIKAIRAPSSDGGITAEESLLPNLARPDTVGIATGEVESEANPFEVAVTPHTAQYKQLKAVPAHYAREKDEFPDFR
jgi:hypothetical protein